MEKCFPDWDGHLRAKADEETGILWIKEGDLRIVISVSPGDKIELYKGRCYTFIERTESGAFRPGSYREDLPPGDDWAFSGLMKQVY